MSTHAIERPPVMNQVERNRRRNEELAKGREKARALKTARRLTQVADIRGYLSKVHQRQGGWLPVCTKDRRVDGPLLTKWFVWPGEHDEAVSFIEDAHSKGLEVWSTQCLFATQSRTKEAALPTLTLTWELDHEPEGDERKVLDALGADVIASGTKGHYHVVVYVARPLEANDAHTRAQLLALGCGVHKGGAEDGGKFEPSGLTRFPYTSNFKTDPPKPVKLVRHATRVWDFDSLDALVDSLDLKSCATSVKRATNNDIKDDVKVTEEAYEGRLSDGVRAMLANNDDDDGTQRWDRTYSLVCALKEAGLTPGQSKWVLAGNTDATNDDEGNPQRWEPIYSKFGSAVDAQILRIYKAHDTKNGKKPCDDEFGALAAYAGTHTLDDLWDHSAVTRHILTSARGQIVGPMTLFLSLMMEALMRVPPHIVLPAAVGGHASLNMQIGLMAESGGSKGASASVVDMCMNFDRDSYSVGIGTGEGITSQYGEWVKESVSWKRTAVLFTAAEISTIEALANRVGSTLIADLTKAWSGEPLGYANRRKETSIQLKSHRYRLGFITGVQPVKAHILLKHVGQGFVERFLFARGDDPDADDSYSTPRPIDWPGNRALDSMIDEIPEDEFDLDTKQKIDNLVQITIPGHVHTAIRKHQVYKRRGGTINALDSHAMLLRLKVAAGIAALHGQFKEITDTDWDLAGAIMRHHRETRDHTLAVLSKESAKANEAKAVAAGRYAAKSEQVAETLRLQATKDLIVDKLKGAMGPVAGNKLKKTLTIGKRQLFEPALAELVGEGTVIDIPAKQNGHVYELATD